MDLFVAGSDTTTITLRFALLYLIMHPDVQVKVQEEIDRVVGQDRSVTLQDKYGSDSIPLSMICIFITAYFYLGLIV